MASPDSIQSEALIALVEEQGWKRMAILTSNTDYGLSVLAAKVNDKYKRITVPDL